MISLSGVLLGCNRHPAAPEFPAINPQETAARAIALYDRSGDGQLDSQELAASPALANSREQIDRDGNGLLSAEEISSRVDQWLSSGTSLVDVVVEVVLDGRPLGDAEVAVEPEEFLGTSYRNARSVTNDSGLATFAGHDPRLPGLHLGFYRVRIHAKDAAGNERLPDKYNRETELGMEIAANKGSHSRFELRSRL